jgi:hypothetical protein
LSKHFVTQSVVGRFVVGLIVRIISMSGPFGRIIDQRGLDGAGRVAEVAITAYEVTGLLDLLF